MKSSLYHIHDSLTKSVRSGKTPQYLEKLLSVGIEDFYQLLWLFPLHLERIPEASPFAQIEEGNLFRGRAKVVQIQARPSSIKAKYGKKIPLKNIRVTLKDFYSGQMVTANWFNCYPSMISKIEALEDVYFFGRPQRFNGQMQFNNPTLIEDGLHDELIIQYPTIKGINPATLKKFIHRVLPKIDWTENLPAQVIEKYNFMGLKETFYRSHGLLNSEPEELERAKQRLIYQEFFDSQLKIQARKNLVKDFQAPVIESDEQELSELKKIFPYQLTDDQVQTLSEIASEIKMGHPMMRLVQGDVGSGKTSVAIVTAKLFANRGLQAALMCPTETLARQHFKTFSSLLSEGTRIELLVGSTPLKRKTEIKDRLKNGDIDIIIGTHALFQKDVEFSKLGLAIIDEQHKFGVDQRLSLIKKGAGTHCLILTATPIPRSLRLTHFGDLEVSLIKQKPGHQRPIKSRIVTPAKMAPFLSFLKTRLELGEQGYVVVPAIEEVEGEDLPLMQNVHEVFQKFSQLYPEEKLGLLHGQMKSDEKNDVMERFYRREITLLVSTTVVEVGIDNPNATVMAIINPERFGLSSLHQLRGRVGRGDRPGFCFLVTDRNLSKAAMDRLKVIEDSNDGFEIAEQDLRFRGEGDIYGRDQSGAPTRKIASLIDDYSVLADVAKDIEQLDLKGEPFVANTLEKLQQQIIVTHTV